MYSLLAFLLSYPVALALDKPPAALRPPTTVGIASGGVLGVVCTGLTWLFTAAIVFSIVMVLVAAYEYMQGGSSPDKVKKATNRLIFVAIGIVVAILARSVPVLIANFIGADGAGDTSTVCR